MRFAKNVSRAETRFLLSGGSITAELVGAFLIPSVPVSSMVKSLAFKVHCGFAGPV
jgi:hypothetical protein